MKLTKRQLDALQESIYHWYENLYLALAGMEISRCGHDCALCVEFFYEVPTEDQCCSCPVKEETGELFCEATPHSNTYGGMVSDVIAEIHFLESLDTGE